MEKFSPWHRGITTDQGSLKAATRLDFLKPAGTPVVTGQKGNFMAARTQTETEANHTHMLPEASVPIPQLGSGTLLVLVPKGFCLLLSAQLPSSLSSQVYYIITGLEPPVVLPKQAQQVLGQRSTMDPRWVWCQWYPQPTCCPPTSPAPARTQPKSLQHCSWFDAASQI